MTTIQPKKKCQSCLNLDRSDYLNKWTFAIFALFLLMATSVALAICFPYQGTEPYLRVTADSAVMDAVVVDSTVVDSTVVVEDATVLVEDNSSNADDVMVINKQNNDMSTTTTDQEVVVVSSSPLHTIDVAEASSVPSVAQDGGDNNDNNNNNNNSIGGLFGSSATATDEQPSSGAQTDAVANGAESDSDNNSSSSSSCQMKLRLADANLDYIIDASEYITFLQHFVGDIPLGTTQFDELESEYQVNFDHLAMAHTSNNGGDGGDDNDTNGVVGIPIATMEEMQKVCVYISNKGS